MSRSTTQAALAFHPLGERLRALLVWPKIPSSFWSFAGMMRLLPEKAAMPPLGLITVAALCPVDWELKLVDLALDELSDEDISWADLVMVSAMQVQMDSVEAVLLRARRLGRRTIIGGPYASSEPELLLEIADHVVVGEPDEAFPEIARDLETGCARRLYEIREKPAAASAPIPRFDLLKLDQYSSMPIQFSRGCPFQCEFCDIITIYGRVPRVKAPRQLLAELDALAALGWRKEVFIVDDNFIGNRKLALEMLHELRAWQQARNFPFAFYTEASIDLAERPALIEAMVEANFLYVFVGIESPSAESLTETKKFQNLRQDPLAAVQFLQRKGLWVTAGFIVGFDSDDEETFGRQIELIESAAIPWAMAGFLKAPPTTALYKRLLEAERLIDDRQSIDNFSPPNFRTRMPLATLLKGLQRILATIYDPEVFYERAYRSLRAWESSAFQKGPARPFLQELVILFLSVWHQGIRSCYRRAYWKFFLRLLVRWALCPPKLWLGFVVLLSGHHFIPYAREVVERLAEEVRKVEGERSRTAPAGPRASGRGGGRRLVHDLH